MKTLQQSCAEKLRLTPPEHEQVVRNLWQGFVRSGRTFDFSRALRLAYARKDDKMFEHADVLSVADAVTHIFEFELVRDYASGGVSIVCEGVTVYERTI